MTAKLLFSFTRPSNAARRGRPVSVPQEAAASESRLQGTNIQSSAWLAACHPGSRRAMSLAALTVLAMLLIGAGGIAPAAAQSINYATLYAFANNGSDGQQPLAGLIQATDGNFYGTTYTGGVNGYGTVFKVTPGGAETVLHSFPDNASDGASPRGLIQATDGNFYGTTFAGGGTSAYGTVFKITPDGTETVLHAFDTNGADGYELYAGLVQAADGNFYGTTFAGGAYGHGTVFKITPGGTETVLHAFDTNGADESGPVTSLIQATDGNLYGTTLYGGVFPGPEGYGAGTVFKITPSGTYTVLHRFAGNNSEGAYPQAALVQATDGNLYGTTQYGGVHDYGTVFKITPGGTETVLHAFANDGSDGNSPFSSLLQAADGNFYGTTRYGGTYGPGTVFVFSLGGSAPVVSSLTPSSTPACGPAFTLTVNGSSFVSGAVINWNGAALTTTFVSATKLTASVPASDIAAPGTASITVSQSGQTSNAATFTITNPAPVVKSLSPSSADAGGPGFTLIVKGSCFLNSSVVDWNGASLSTTFVSAAELKAVVPASLIASSGTAQVTVVTPSPGGGTSASKPFTILQTTLKLAGASLTRNTDGSYTAVVSIKNAGFLAANNTAIKKSTLGAANTSTTLPLAVGSIAAGATATATLKYSSAAGTSGSVVKLVVSGAFTGGTFSGSLKAMLP